MIKKSKARFTILILSVLILLLATTVGVIYASTVRQLTQRNRQMLSLYTSEYWKNGSPDKQTDRNGNQANSAKAPPDGKPSDELFASSTFFSVAFTSDSSTDITNDNAALYTDEELTALARHISEEPDGYGTKGKLAYLKAEKNGTILVVFMSNSALGESKQILLRNTLIYAAAAIPVLALLSWLCAGWAMRPMEESYKKQKQFIADAGHELKTPLSTISANLELLGRDAGESRWLNNIRYENERMEELVSQFLELAQLACL